MITAAIKVFARKNAFDQSYPTSKIINHLVREFAFFQPFCICSSFNNGDAVG